MDGAVYLSVCYVSRGCLPSFLVEGLGREPSGVEREREPFEGLWEQVERELEQLRKKGGSYTREMNILG